MLAIFKDIFGDEFFNNTAIVFTHWQQNKRAKKERRKQRITEENKIQSINIELKNMNIGI